MNASASNDPREYLDDLLDQLTEGEIRRFAKGLEETLPASRTELVRAKHGGESPAGPLVLKHLPSTMPDHVRYTVPIGKRFPSFAQPGDVLAGRLLTVHGLPHTTPACERRGLIGKWLLLRRWEAVWPKNGAGGGIQGYTDKGSTVLRLERSTHQWITGRQSERPSRNKVDVSSVSVHGVYEILSVHPGSDRDWRADRGFVVAVAKCGIPVPA